MQIGKTYRFADVRLPPPRFATPDLAAADFVGAAFGADFTVDFAGADFAGADLAGAPEAFAAGFATTSFAADLAAGCRAAADFRPRDALLPRNPPRPLSAATSSTSFTVLGGLAELVVATDAGSGDATP